MNSLGFFQLLKIQMKADAKGMPSVSVGVQCVSGNEERKF